jgi:signal transduction histidine kinase
MVSSRSSKAILAAWVLFVGGAAAVCFLLPPGSTKSVCGDLLLCLVPLFANACLLWNAVTRYRRTNAFWRFLALGCSMWLGVQLTRTYFDLVLHRSPALPLLAYVVIFLHVVPLLAALVLRPHVRGVGESLRAGRIDFCLLAWLFLYAYVFLAVPWRLISPNAPLFEIRDFQLCTVENVIFLAALGFTATHARGKWRPVYAHLFGASVVYLAGRMLGQEMSWRGTFQIGGFADLLRVISFVWIATAGVVAHQLSPSPDPVAESPREDGQWQGKLGMLGVLLTVFPGGWSLIYSDAPMAVRIFRALVTLAGMAGGAALVFLRQHHLDRERSRLVQELKSSLENTKRLQSQLMHTEKLASLGQLAAGAAHEINNPLTAILGYSDLLIEESTAGERARGLGEKIRDQARRTRDLVTNLSSFARRVPAEKQLLDLNTVLSGAVQLRTLDLRGKNIRIELKSPAVLPAVRGDPNQLLQVIYHIISNAVDAMENGGPGVLTIRAMREKSNVAVEFSDDGPGILEPERVFDPFYTTKPVGKGAGLGLSICYGILQEHGGQITCKNRPDRGCTFRIELPAMLNFSPEAQVLPPVATHAR